MSKYATITAIASILLVALLAGMWVGNLTAPSISRDPSPTNETAPVAAESTEVPRPPSPPADAPLYFHARLGAGADFSAVKAEMTMAIEAGIDRHIAGFALPWNEAGLKEFETIAGVILAGGARELTLEIDWNPPDSWLEEHPEETWTIDGETFSSIASNRWIAEANDRFTVLWNALPERAVNRIATVIPMGLEEGHWYRRNGYDTSPANASAFRAWLAQRYGSEEALQETWDDPEAALTDAAVPEPPGGEGGTFFILPGEQRHVDYLRYVSEITADQLRTIATHITAVAGPGVQVLVPYGHGFELTHNDAGHFALQSLLDGPIAGFAGPVSSASRGIGGVGGPTGAVDSVMLHGLRWLVVDNTRTGIERNGEGAFVRRPELRFSDVLNVFHRNFAMALLHGQELAWADALGQGNLHERELWEAFADLRGVHESLERDGVLSSGFGGGLLVVLDEESRFYQRRGRELNQSLLAGARDAALKVGVPVRFVTLRDVVEGRTGYADVYLFVNAFALTEEDRRRLHERFAYQEAAVLWLYAPGYFGEDGPRLDHVAATAEMTVKAFDEPAPSGSVYTLTGNWLTSGQTFGLEARLSPLFYVDDPDADVVARYRESDHASVAVKFVRNRWTSVLICEPVVTVELLREIFDILEIPLVVRRRSIGLADTLQMRKDLVLIHANAPGERLLDFGVAHDIVDLLNPAVGWNDRQVITFLANTGDTHLFRLTPPAAHAH